VLLSAICTLVISSERAFSIWSGENSGCWSASPSTLITVPRSSVSETPRRGGLRVGVEAKARAHVLDGGGLLERAPRRRAAVEHRGDEGREPPRSAGS
jgi:hypothetical protein